MFISPYECSGGDDCDDNIESQVGFFADDCSVVETHTSVSTYFSLLRRAIRALILGAGASFAAAAFRSMLPRSFGFIGSYVMCGRPPVLDVFGRHEGTVGRLLLLVALTRLLPLVKGLYRGIVRSRGVCYYGSSGSGGGHGAVIGGFGVFLSSYVGLPYKILRRK